MPDPVVNDDYQALEPDESWRSRLKRTLKRARFYILVIALIVFALLSLMQYICYNIGTMGCDPKSLHTYTYPFGDDMLSPDIILIEEDHYFWKTFMATKTDAQGIKRGEALGYFYQVWGPFTYTTGFRDPFGHTLFASTANEFAIGSSKSIYRCDGKDEIFTLAEGSNWFLNRIRNLFGTFTATEYNIYRGSTLVAISAKVGYSSKNLLIHGVNADKALAEASLVTRGFHGKYDEWIFHMKPDAKANSTLPSFVAVTTTALMAFRIEDKKKAEQSQSGSRYPEYAALPTLTTSSEAARVVAKSDMTMAATSTKMSTAAAAESLEVDATVPSPNKHAARVTKSSGTDAAAAAAVVQSPEVDATVTSPVKHAARVTESSDTNAAGTAAESSNMVEAKMAALADAETALPVQNGSTIK